MRSLFQNLDLYKVIILVSLVLLPGVGFWAYYLEGQLDVARDAIRSATKKGGDLEEIGKFQKAVMEQKKRKGALASPDDLDVYFEKGILSAVKKGTRGLSTSDFQIRRKQEESALRNKAVDTPVSVSFKRGGSKDYPLSRKFLLAVLFNLESQSPIWKLRKLEIRNDSAGRASPGKPPPMELEDDWSVKEMTFVSRRPKRN